MTDARLHAVVSLQSSQRVRCQQPGCGHSIYASVYVVEEGGQLMVLGSTCFAKRYGGLGALGSARHGGASGLRLTEEEIALLEHNTRSLLAMFDVRQEQERMSREREALERATGRIRSLQSHHDHDISGVGSLGRLDDPASPWSWQKRGTRLAMFQSPRGQSWFWVRHRDGSQKLVPWPKIRDWAGALPVGSIDEELGALTITDVAAALEMLKHEGFAEPQVGTWAQLMRRRFS